MTSIDPRTLPTAETVRRTVLADGTVLLVRENAASPAVVVQGLVMAGAIDDPSERTGLARFMAECLTRGTKTRTTAELYEAAESLGATFGVSGGVHTSRFGAKCLAQDIPALLDILGDVLRHPVFPAEEIEKVRGDTLTEIEERDHDTRSVSDLAYRRLAYPSSHPYARPAEGTMESVESISRDDLVALYERTIPSRHRIVSIVGAIDADEIAALVEKLWVEKGGARSAPPDGLPTIDVVAKRRTEHVVVPGKVQVDLAWGRIGPRRSDPDFLAANVANLVLGGFGMMGRLGLHVREEQGLAYYATSRLSGGLGPGPWSCIAGVAPEHFRRAVDTIAAEVATMRNDVVPEEELEDSKAYLTGSLPLKLESNEGMANVMIEIELYDLGWDYLLRFPDEVAAIGPEEVKSAIGRYFPENAEFLASAGPEVAQ